MQSVALLADYSNQGYESKCRRSLSLCHLDTCFTHRPRFPRFPFAHRVATALLCRRMLGQPLQGNVNVDLSKTQAGERRREEGWLCGCVGGCSNETAISCEPLSCKAPAMHSPAITIASAPEAGVYINHNKPNTQTHIHPQTHTHAHLVLCGNGVASYLAVGDFVQPQLLDKLLCAQKKINRQRRQRKRGWGQLIINKLQPR